MNIVDKLLKMDAKKAEELQTGTVKSKRLAKLLGEKEAEIKIREIKSRRLNDIVSYQIDGKGNFDYAKSYDAKIMMCVEGITEPDLRNKDLQGHFGCKSAKELCEKLFGMEITMISDEISLLSGVETDTDTEEEVKN